MSNRTIKLIPYSKEKFPQTKTINEVPVEEATKKYQTVKVITDEQGKPVKTGEDYFIDEQGNPLKPKELQEVVISAPAHLSDEEYRQYLLNSQDFNRRQGLPINYDNIPLFTYDNGITGKRNVNRNTYERYIAADNKSRAFNKQMDAIVAGATGIMASPYLLGAAALIPFHSVAPGTVAGNFVGDAAGSMAGMEASNLLSKKLTGKTVDQHINRTLGVDDNSFTGQWVTPMLNPAGYATMAFSPIINAPKTAVTEFADNLAKQYTNQVNPGLVKKSQRVLQNSWDKAKQTVYDKWNKFNQIPEIELFKNHKKDFLLGRITQDMNPYYDEYQKTLRLLERTTAPKLHKKNVYDNEAIRFEDTLDQNQSHYNNVLDKVHTGIGVEIPNSPSIQKLIDRDQSRPLKVDPHTQQGVYEIESVVYNPFTGTSTPIHQQQLIDTSKYNESIRFDITFPFIPNEITKKKKVSYTPIEDFGPEELAIYDDIPSPEEIYQYFKIVPNITGIFKKESGQITFSPIKTVEGDLQKGAQEIKTSIENAIGDEGLVAGSVYKLSNGHFQGSSLLHNPNSAPHDIEIWTYSNEAADDIAKKLGLKFTGTGRITRKYSHPNGTEFEFAVIGKNPDTGKARGDLAWQLFETYNPDEALAIKRQHIFNGEPYQNVDLPITPEELYQVYQKNPQLMDRRTVLDTITAASNSIGDNGLSTKQKHNDRTVQMLMNPQNAERMNDAISHLYKQIWGTTEGEKKLPSKVYQAIDYNDIEANKFFLEKLGFSKEISEKMATNPQQMQNVFNYWYLQKICGKRFGSFGGNKTEDNALQVLSTNVSPNGHYGMGGGGNSSTSPVWDWNGDFTGLIYNPLTYKPETITNLQKAIEKYEAQHDIHENVLKYTRNQGESLDDYIKRVAQQSQDLDIPITYTEDHYLGRFSIPKKEDVGQLQTGESVKVGGVFSFPKADNNLQTHNVFFQDLPYMPDQNGYSIDTILEHPEEYKDIIQGLQKEIPDFADILKMSEKKHIPFSEAYTQYYSGVKKRLAKVERKLLNNRNNKAWKRAKEMKEFEYARDHARKLKLEKKLDDITLQQNRRSAVINNVNRIIDNIKTGATASGFFGGIGFGIYELKELNKKARENRDSKYIQEITQGTLQQAMIRLEIDKEEALKRCHSNSRKSDIEEHYTELKSRLVDYYSKKASAKIVNEPSVQPTEDASIAQAVQNARKKYRLGGILKYKQYE